MPRPRKPDIGPTLVPISPEAAMQQVTRLLRERAPQSIEEVNAIMDELMSQPLEEATPETPSIAHRSSCTTHGRRRARSAGSLSRARR